MEFITLKFMNDAAGIRNKNAAAVQLSNEGWRLVSEQIQQGQFRGARACCLSSACCLPAGAMAGRTAGFIVVTFSRDQLPAGIPQETAEQIQYRFRERTSADNTSDQLAGFGKALQREWNAASPIARKIIVIVTGIILLLLVFAFLIHSTKTSENLPNNMPQPQSSEATPITHVEQVNAAFHLPSLVLKKRKEVQRALGKPTSYKHRRDEGEIGDPAEYPWGMVAYNHDRLVFVHYKFPKKPIDYSEAFKYLGLPSPTPPYIRGDGTMLWTSSHNNAFASPTPNAYSCCDVLTLHGIFIPGDYSEINIEVIDLDDPENWSNAECDMWTKVTRKPAPTKAKCL